MSFILEALKKSENERQRHDGPSLANVLIRRSRQERPWWAIVLMALLTINLLVLAIVLSRNGNARIAPTNVSASFDLEGKPADHTRRSMPLPPSAERTEAAAGKGAAIAEGPPAASPTAPSAAPHNPAVRSLADEADPNAGAGADISDPYLHLSGAAGIPDGPPMVRRIEAPATRPAAEFPSQTGRPAAKPAMNEEVLPSIDDMIAAGTPLPDMHLDIHVYSATPEERFVFVNMRKYTEGQSLNEGPLIERITADGLILNHQGRRFLLPRQ